MAKKLRKAPRSPLVLVVELLIPWISMGVAAITLDNAGFTAAVVFGGALSVALTATVLIYLYENRRRRGH
jgi:hypothetical protein